MPSVALRPPIVAALSGSYRTGSLNSKLLRFAATLLKTKGSDVRILDLGQYRLPVFDEDQEAASFPEGAAMLKADLKAADGLLIASPEYNGFPTPALVNAITWATRGEGGMYDAFQGKVGAVLSCSPGPMGGIRGLGPTRGLLQSCG